MGTFHHDKGALHGITVVVRTSGSRIWVGRCDTIDERGVHLLDADACEDAAPGVAQAWLAQAAKVGVWPRHPRALVPAAEVLAVEPLGSLRRN